MKRFILLMFCLVAVSLSCSFLAPSEKAEIPPTATSLVAVGHPPVPLGTKTPIVEDVTAYRSLNVRALPGLQARVVGYLYNMDTVTLTGKCDDGWAEIVWKDGVAWVNSAYLSRNKCSKEER